MHPLAPNLSELTTEEVTAKYSDLTKKLNQAYRMGNNSLVNQISMLLEDYRSEMARRQQKLLDDANKNANFKNIIDIN